MELHRRNTFNHLRNSNAWGDRTFRCQRQRSRLQYYGRKRRLPMRGRHRLERLYHPGSKRVCLHPNFNNLQCLDQQPDYAKLYGRLADLCRGDYPPRFWHYCGQRGLHRPVELFVAAGKQPYPDHGLSTDRLGRAPLYLYQVVRRRQLSDALGHRANGRRYLSGHIQPGSTGHIRRTACNRRCR